MEYKSNEKRSNTARLMHNEFTFTFSVNTLGDNYEQTCTKRHKHLSLAPQESRSKLLVYTKGLPCFLSEANTQYRQRSLHLDSGPRPVPGAIVIVCTYNRLIMYVLATYPRIEVMFTFTLCSSLAFYLSFDKKNLRNRSMKLYNTFYYQY